MPPCLQAQSFNDEWDPWFQEYTAKYLYGLVPDDDWRWQKAQCWQESRLRAHVVSPAGAAGVCQLMVSAASDFGLASHERFDAQKNIRAGAWILRRNIRAWFPRETRFQRLQLGLASYNAGAGWIIKAQSRCGGAMYWPQIAPCLNYITGLNHSRETIDYVIFVNQWYQAMTNEP